MPGSAPRRGAATDLNPGTAFELLPGRITRTTLALFAGGSGDHNPIHIDLDVARSAGFDDVFAHGMLSAAYLGRLLTERFGQERLRRLNLRFTALTPVNAEPKCTATVLEVSEDTATLELAVTLPDGTQTVAGSAVIVLASRQPR